MTGSALHYSMLKCSKKSYSHTSRCHSRNSHWTLDYNKAE